MQNTMYMYYKNISKQEVHKPYRLPDQAVISSRRKFGPLFNTLKLPVI